MRRLLRFTSLLVILCALLLTGVRIVGGMNKPPVLLESTACTTQLCWNGIEPGITLIQEAKTLVLSHFQVIENGYKFCTEPGQCWILSMRSWSAEYDASVGVLQLQPPPGKLTLGDLMLRYGAPISANLCWIAGPTSGNVPTNIPRPSMIAYIAFSGNIRVAAYNPYEPSLRRFDPYMNVVWVNFQPGYTASVPPWRGFALPHNMGCRGR